MKSKTNRSSTPRRVSVASLGAPKGPVKFSVAAIRRFVSMPSDEAQKAIMRRAVPGRHKLDEKRQREAMVGYVHHIQRSPASKRAWLARSAPGRVAMPEKASLSQALARQTPQEKAAAMPKPQRKKKVAKKVAKKKVAKKAATRRKAQARKPAAAATRQAPAKKPNQAKKVSRVAKKGFVERAAAGIKQARKVATKAASKGRKAAAEGAATVRESVAQAIKSVEAKDMRLVDPRDRKDAEQGLPVWMEPCDPVAEDKATEQAAS